jgi:hypothetical protein
MTNRNGFLRFKLFAKKQGKSISNIEILHTLVHTHAHKHLQ